MQANKRHSARQLLAELTVCMIGSASLSSRLLALAVTDSALDEELRESIDGNIHIA